MLKVIQFHMCLINNMDTIIVVGRVVLQSKRIYDHQLY